MAFETSGSLVLTRISSRIVSTTSSASSASSSPGCGADNRQGFRCGRKVVLFGCDGEVARGNFGLPRAELGRQDKADDAGDAGDASTDVFWGAVEPLF